MFIFFDLSSIFLNKRPKPYSEMFLCLCNVLWLNVMFLNKTDSFWYIKFYQSKENTYVSTEDFWKMRKQATEKQKIALRDMCIHISDIEFVSKIQKELQNL